MNEPESQRDETTPEEAQPTVVIPRPARFARFRRGSDEGTSGSGSAEPTDADPSHTAILVPPERLEGEDTVIVPIPDADADDPDVGDASEPEALPSRASLERERRSLIDQREAALYHLGGLAFEVYRRDDLPEGAMQERAEVIAGMERRLAEIDARIVTLAAERAERREQRSRPAAPTTPQTVGTCAACGTGYFPDAHFCFNCGASIEAAAGDEAEPNEPSDS